MTEFIVAAAGYSTRWGGTDKCLLTVDGERILDRTVRLLNERGIDPLVVRRHDQEQSWKRVLDPELTEYDVDKFLSSSSAWKASTCILLGDVWFSERAIDLIVKDPHPHRLVWWGRLGESLYTGKPWGELFAVRFRALQKDCVFARACWHVRRRFGLGYLSTCRGWDVREHLYRTCPAHQFTAIIDDATEDFDRPEDLDAWLQRNALTRSASTAI